MRKKIVLTSLCLLFAVSILYLQCIRRPSVFHAVTIQSTNGYCSELTIIANKLIICSRSKLEADLIEHIRNNDFKNMMFSYDVMGYPKECNVTVYTNNWTKKLGIPAFTFRYAM